MATRCVEYQEGEVAAKVLLPSPQGETWVTAGPSLHLHDLPSAGLQPYALCLPGLGWYSLRSMDLPLPPPALRQCAQSTCFAHSHPLSSLFGQTPVPSRPQSLWQMSAPAGSPTTRPWAPPQDPVLTGLRGEGRRSRLLSLPTVNQAGLPHVGQHPLPGNLPPEPQPGEWDVSPQPQSRLRPLKRTSCSLGHSPAPPPRSASPQSSRLFEEALLSLPVS